MFKKLKNKKGFTLVELIVVLVILAILAALLIPALTGYIDKARNKQIIAETRSAVMAAQTLVDEAYSQTTKKVEATTTAAADVTVGDKTVKATDIATLAELDSTHIKGIKINASGKVTYLEYDTGKVCKYAVESADAPAADTFIEQDGNYYVINGATS